MLENRPFLKDRLKACGVFTGIAIAGISGFEMVIGAGFDILTPGREIREVAPSSYVEVDRSPWFSDARVIPLSSTEPMFIGDTARTEERLAGRYDDERAPDRRVAEVSDRNLHRQIEALYRAYNPPEQASVASYAPDEPAQLPAIAEPETPTIVDEQIGEATPDIPAQGEPAAQDEIDIAAAKADKADISASETASPW
jgi:hypothetical protein